MKPRKMIRKLEGLNIVFQGQNGKYGAYPEYFGENRDGYMFITNTVNNHHLWFVVEVRGDHFNVDVMETDTLREYTTDIELCCNLSYKEMIKYITDTIQSIL